MFLIGDFEIRNWGFHNRGVTPAADSTILFIRLHVVLVSYSLVHFHFHQFIFCLLITIYRMVTFFISSSYSVYKILFIDYNLHNGEFFISRVLLLLMGRLLNSYPSKRLPITFTLSVEHGEDQKTYLVIDKERSQESKLLPR